jgi:hypothetical protein
VRSLQVVLMHLSSGCETSKLEQHKSTHSQAPARLTRHKNHITPANSEPPSPDERQPAERNDPRIFPRFRYQHQISYFMTVPTAFRRFSKSFSVSSRCRLSLYHKEAKQGPLAAGLRGPVEKRGLSRGAPGPSTRSLGCRSHASAQSNGKTVVGIPDPCHSWIITK